jgi:type IV pilus assembly protein PilA
MKKSEDGFSLIELIIVIAIMAVLVAIIAPNLIKYLSKSKIETDKKNADEIASQLQTCITDYESENSSDGVESDEKCLIADDDTSAVVTIKWNDSKNGYSSIKNSSSSASSTASDLSDFDRIVNQVVTAKTESKEKSGVFAEAEITKKTETSYSVEVKLGNAVVIK